MITTICYLTTDLDLVSSSDLTPLTKTLEANGLHPLHTTLGQDGKWYSCLETEKQYDNPDANIKAMLLILDSAPEIAKNLWASCTLREFNVGYDCGEEPWAFNSGLSTEALRRMAEVGATLRITLYPPERLNETN